MIDWLKSILKRRCKRFKKHRFDYDLVCDINIPESQVKCLLCNKSFTALAQGKRARFKYLPPGKKGGDGSYTIEYLK